MHNFKLILGAGVAVAALWFLPLSFPSDYFVTLGARLLAMVVLAGSFNLLMGYLALSSFGHSALFGVGGYAVAILLRLVDVDISVALLASMLAGGVCAALLGPFMLRTTGVYFILLSLALGQVLWGIADSWRSVTGGSDGLLVYAVPSLAGHALDDSLSVYRLVCAAAVLSIVALFIIVHSPFGAALRGIREGEVRMVALGFNVFRLKLVALILSGVFAGLAGGLLVVINRFISPDAMSVRLAVELVLSVIIGGRGAFWGPLVAAFLLFAGEEAISSFSPLWPLFLGLLFMAVVFVLRFDLVRRLVSLFHSTQAGTDVRPMA